MGEIDVLIRSAGNQHDGAIEGIEGRSDGLRYRSGGIVVPVNAILLGEKLEAMLDPRKGGDGSRDCRGIESESAARERRGEEIFALVLARDEEAGRKDFFRGSRIAGGCEEAAARGLGLDPCARDMLLDARVPEDARARLGREGSSPWVVGVAYGIAVLVLVSVYEALVGYVFLHRRIAIHVIGHDAGNDRDTRLENSEAAHIGQLPGRQLQHDGRI